MIFFTKAMPSWIRWLWGAHKMPHIAKWARQTGWGSEEREERGKRIWHFSKSVSASFGPFKQEMAYVADAHKNHPELDGIRTPALRNNYHFITATARSPCFITGQCTKHHVLKPESNCNSRRVVLEPPLKPNCCWLSHKCRALDERNEFWWISLFSLTWIAATGSSLWPNADG